MVRVCSSTRKGTSASSTIDWPKVPRCGMGRSDFCRSSPSVARALCSRRLRRVSQPQHQEKRGDDGEAEKHEAVDVGQHIGLPADGRGEERRGPRRLSTSTSIPAGRRSLASSRRRGVGMAQNSRINPMRYKLPCTPAGDAAPGQGAGARAGRRRCRTAAAGCMGGRHQARRRVTEMRSSMDATPPRRSADDVRSRRLSRQCGFWPPIHESRRRYRPRGPSSAASGPDFLPEAVSARSKALVGLS
jgi:hypothetical protein